MSIIIEKNLNSNIIDYLLLQSIAETKLNRELKNPTNPEEILKFYEKYFLNNKVLDDETKKLFKVSVGAIASLDDDISNANKINYNNADYEGGAGTFTKITEKQAEYFLSKYEILDYHGNDESGFSATVFKNKETNEITISFRSTEFIEDYKKDTTTDKEITDNGTAIAQNISMIQYIEDLKSKQIIKATDNISITGYSLGGHIASNFFKMYEDEFNLI